MAPFPIPLSPQLSERPRRLVQRRLACPILPSDIMICRMGPAGRVIASSKFLAPLLVLLVLWPVLIRIFDVNPQVFPDITAVARAGLETVRDGSLLAHVGASLARVAVGTVLAILTAVPLGLAMGVSPAVSDFLTPLLRFFSVVAVLVKITITTL